MLNDIVLGAPLFFLIAVRILAIIELAPLLSSDAIPQVAKVSLAGFAAFCVYPSFAQGAYLIPGYGLEYVFLVIGEAVIGVVIAFYLVLIYTAFQTAGQFFALQMGLSASETFDPLAQIEIPIVGQFLNLLAMLVFLINGGFQKLFLLGVQGSFKAMTAYDLMYAQKPFLDLISKGLINLFQDSLILSFPILGTLFLVTVGMGLLSKAAPQMNLMTEGFPVSITVAWILLMVAMPFMMEAFGRLIDTSFNDIAQALDAVHTASTSAAVGGLK